MPNKPKPIIILGGGPTGLAAAYKLAKLGRRFVLVEKEKYIGGLSATRRRKNYLYEYGPHAFHLKDKEIINWLKDILGVDFRVIPTKTQVIIGGKLLDYPLRAGELLRKANPVLGLIIIFDYIWENLKRFLFRGKWQNFHEWGVANFGRTLYRISFGDYTAKVWGMHPSKLSAGLATGKLSKLNLREVVAKTVGIKGKQQPLFFKQYLYPKNGMAGIFQHMIRELKGKGEIILGSKVTQIQTRGGRAVSIELENDGGQKTLACEKVISTLPLKQLVKMIGKPLNKNIIASANKLNYRDFIIVYAAVNESSLPDSQWIYLVENKFKFNRVAINKNLSPNFSVNGNTLLAFEICCQKNDRLWNKQDGQLLEMVKVDMEKLGWQNIAIKDFFVERLTNVYPIYLVGYEKNVRAVIEGISDIDNLISTGRNGLFLNSDIHDCFQMGFEAADFIVKDKSVSGSYYQKTGSTWLKK